MGGRARRRSRRRLAREERGQATIEFAIVVPLVLLLIVGMIEFAKAFNYWIDLNHLANEGARWAAVDKVPPYAGNPGQPAPTCQQIKDYLASQLNTNELQQDVLLNDGIKLVVDTPSGAGGTPTIGDAASVTISTPYEFPLVSGVIQLAGQLFGSGTGGIATITLSGKATQRLEQKPTWTSSSTPCP